MEVVSEAWQSNHCSSLLCTEISFIRIKMKENLVTESFACLFFKILICNCVFFTFNMSGRETHGAY